MDEIAVTLLDDNEPIPPDAIVLPALKDMHVEDAVRLLRSHGLDEADARFEVALARGEVDGDLIPVREGELEPDFEEMETEDAVRHLMEYWGLGEVDARFHLALVRGETDGDTHAVDDDGQPVRTSRQHHAAG